MCELLQHGIDQALRVEAVHVLLRDRDGSFAARNDRVRPLDAVSPLLSDLGGGIVELDLEQSGARRRPLSEPDLDWAADANARRLVRSESLEPRGAPRLLGQHRGDRLAGLTLVCRRPLRAARDVDARIEAVKACLRAATARSTPPRPSRGHRR